MLKNLGLWIRRIYYHLRYPEYNIRCSICSKPLDFEEIKYYGHTCEQCESEVSL